MANKKQTTSYPKLRGYMYNDKDEVIGECELYANVCAYVFNTTSCVKVKGRMGAYHKTDNEKEIRKGDDVYLDKYRIANSINMNKEDVEKCYTLKKLKD